MENFARGEPWKISSYNIPALPHVGVEEESACLKVASQALDKDLNASIFVWVWAFEFYPTIPDAFYAWVAKGIQHYAHLIHPSYMF